MKKRMWVIIGILMAAPVIVYSQTAQRIEEFLNTETISNGQAAWLVLEAAEKGGSGEAFQYALDEGWIPGDAVSDGPARLDQVSLLVMRSFGMDGGLLFRLTGSPHYAYRELVYRNIIQGRSDPEMQVSGERLLFMVNRVLSYQEENQL